MDVKMRMANTALLALFASLTCVPSAFAKPKFIEFEAPGAGTGPRQGTEVYALNESGDVTGVYMDNGSIPHGFVRLQDGSFTTYNSSSYVLPDAINGSASTTGEFYDDESRGFVAAADGNVIPFDAPGSDSLFGTQGEAINDDGFIAGEVGDANGIYHGFLRQPVGRFKMFDIAGAGSGPMQGTFVSGMNDKRAIAGYTVDGNGVMHGYLHRAHGDAAVFDAPGAGTESQQGTRVSAISASDIIGGTYFDSDTNPHGYIRAKDGAIVTVDIAGAQGTRLRSVNRRGDTTGWSIDANGAAHGFVRDASGKTISFDEPAAGTDSGEGTFAESINDKGDITGYYVDAGDLYHGFIRKP
jgi:hypothetical protein